MSAANWCGGLMLPPWTQSLFCDNKGTMPWTVVTLNGTVDGEVAALPADMRARLVRLSGLIEQIGFEALPRDTVKHLEGRLWELRITGRDGISKGA